MGVGERLGTSVASGPLPVRILLHTIQEAPVDPVTPTHPDSPDE